MTLAIRHVRRRVGDTAGFDADAATYIRAVQSADGAALEPAVARAINAFVLGCKADGIWSAIKSSCILMGARTLSGALTALVGSAPTNSNFVSGDYDRKLGLKGNTTTKYLDSNRANNADGQNDNHNAVYIYSMATSGTYRAYMGGSGGTSGSNNIGKGSVVPYELTTRNRSSTVTQTSGTGTHTGFVGISRSVSGSYTLRSGGTNYTVSVTSASPTSDNILVFKRQDGYYADARIAFYSIGTSLTLATLDTSVSDLYTAIGNAIP